MDTSASLTAAGTARSGRWRHKLLALAGAALVALAIVCAARLLWKAPHAGLRSAALVFALCGIGSLAWPVGRRTSLAAHAAGTLVAWLALTALLAAGVYFGDRSRWLWFEASGYNDSLVERLDDDATASAADLARLHPIFRVSAGDPGILLIDKGEHNVDRTIIVPKGCKLLIEPGAVLRFGSGCSLVSYSPVEARGTAAQPIRFEARRHWLKWGVVAVIQAGPSRFEHVQIDDSRHAIINGVDLPGGLTIVETPVEIAHCRFAGAFGKDAVNARRAQIDVHDNEFIGAVQDGLDCDGGSGRVFGNRFIDCGDEGIDLSENDSLVVSGNVVRDARGGRIAADRHVERVRAANKLEFSTKS